MDFTLGDLGSSQNKGPILVPLHTGCRNIVCDQKGPIILRTAHVGLREN